MDVTIHGFKQFYEEFKNRIPISYTIICAGPNNEEQALKDLVSHYGLTDIVSITGMIPHTQLKPYFDVANVGVSYVPLTDYYDFQPVTKTFEYLLSGMPVIATSTSENRKVIEPENGVLVGGTAEEFYFGLKTISENRASINSEKIRTSSMDYSWEKIVQDNLKVYLENLGGK
jgi:glycosyltransferase involved in cell wall biosynthesis